MTGCIQRRSFSNVGKDQYGLRAFTPPSKGWIIQDQVTTGIEALDTLIGGLFVGDNDIWYDDAGSLADVFYLNLIRSSLQQDAALIYASFDRSLKNLIEK